MSDDLIILIVCFFLVLFEFYKGEKNLFIKKVKCRVMKFLELFRYYLIFKLLEKIK